MNLTPWFDEHTKPYRAGWYETRTPVITDQTLMRWWDGDCWRLNANPDGFKVLYQLRRWRGVMK